MDKCLLSATQIDTRLAYAAKGEDVHTMQVEYRAKATRILCGIAPTPINDICRTWVTWPTIALNIFFMVLGEIFLLMHQKPPLLLLSAWVCAYIALAGTLMVTAAEHYICAFTIFVVRRIEVAKKLRELEFDVALRANPEGASRLIEPLRGYVGAFRSVTIWVPLTALSIAASSEAKLSLGHSEIALSEPVRGFLLSNFPAVLTAATIVTLIAASGWFWKHRELAIMQHASERNK